jgi:hypothetical protein
MFSDFLISYLFISCFMNFCLTDLTSSSCVGPRWRSWHEIPRPTHRATCPCPALCLLAVTHMSSALGRATRSLCFRRVSILVFTTVKTEVVRRVVGNVVGEREQRTWLRQWLGRCDASLVFLPTHSLGHDLWGVPRKLMKSSTGETCLNILCHKVCTR